MYKFVTNFHKILETTKQLSGNLVIEKGNVCRPDPVPKFSDLEVIALSTMEAFGGNDFEHAPAWGYCASQSMHYYGCKLHALCGISSVIHSYL